VVATLKTIEAKVAQIVATFGSGDRAVAIDLAAEPAEAALLNGPQHPTVAMDQSDIDKLLASFE
jgi:chemotaxis protein CheZ